MINQLPLTVKAENSIGLLPGQIVYFATTKVLAVPFSQLELQRQNVTVVHTFAEARASVTNDAIGVMLDNETLAQTDMAWLINQYQQGKVIAGLNINMNDFYKIFPAAKDSKGNVVGRSPWVDYPMSTPHYAIIYSGVSPNGQWGGSSQDHFLATSMKTILTKIIEGSKPCKEQ